MKVFQPAHLTKLDINFANNKFKLIIFPDFFYHYIKASTFKFIFIFLGILSLSYRQFFSFIILYLFFEWFRVLAHEAGHALGFIIFGKANWIEIELKNSGGGSTESKYMNDEISNIGFLMLCLLGPLSDLIFSLVLSQILLINYGQAAISTLILLISFYTLKVNIFSIANKDSDGYLIFQTIKQMWVVPNERTLQLFRRKDCH